VALVGPNRFAETPLYRVVPQVSAKRSGASDAALDLCHELLTRGEHRRRVGAGVLKARSGLRRPR
jgi:hypothetical protein